MPTARYTVSTVVCGETNSPLQDVTHIAMDTVHGVGDVALNTVNTVNRFVNNGFTPVNNGFTKFVNNGFGLALPRFLSNNLFRG